MKKEWLEGFVLLLIVLGVVGCFVMIGRGDLTTDESVLYSAILTVLTVLGSSMVTRYHSEATFNANLRVFALKAAEKVDNLSKELDRLSFFLQSTLEDTDYDSPVTQLQSRDTRIEGAIHIINTLKSVNDRSLSDWQGVLGAEINQQRQEREEREEDLRELLARVESLNIDNLVATQEEGTAAVRSEITAIRDEVKILAGQVGGIPIKRPVPRRRRAQVVDKCPECDHEIRFTQKEKLGSHKIVKCTKCGMSLLSRFTDTGFVLERRQAVVEKVGCAWCNTVATIELDNAPTGRRIDVSCAGCGGVFRVTRTPYGLRITPIDPLEDTKDLPVDDQLMDEVRRRMPPQPWPSGATKLLAEELRVSTNQVQKAVKELTRRGEFKVQIEGKLYVPDDDGSDSDEASQ